MASAQGKPPDVADLAGQFLSGWKPRGDGPELVVMQGEITECTTDAIVNAANSDLVHGGKVARAISQKGGSVIQDESASWIRKYKRLRVGSAMFTISGKLPCKVVIHTVGPDVGHQPQPTPIHTQQLRDAVKSALTVCGWLGLVSIALPAISTGIYRYPLDQGAAEILDECVKFCREQLTSSIRLIILINVDDTTANSFNRALANVAGNEAVFLHRPIESTLRSNSDAKRNQQRSSTKHRKVHKAAGVLSIRVSSSGFQVLLGVEYRPFDNPPGRFVNLLGGKRDPKESSIATAGREFSEEVGRLVQKKDIQQLLVQKERSKGLWLPFAKYMLYIVHPGTRFDSLPQDYEKRMKEGKLGTGAEHDCLLWVPWLTLVDVVHNTPSRPVVQTPLGPVPVSAMLARFVQQFGSIAKQQFELLGMSVLVRKERARINRLNCLDDDELIETMAQRDWKLRLTSPPIPPPPPIELLTPQDSDYKSIVDNLPSQISSNIVSVRRVQASARIASYKSEVQRLKSQSKAVVIEAEPLYHGTPERWRSTAIALNGFDLGIRLCGRCQGNGVYTATDPNTAYSYCRKTGSILCLRGAITSNCNNSGENTILPGDPVRVFPNPKCVLPRFIIDLAAENSRDTLERQRQSANDEYRLFLEKREAMEVSIKSQEAEFTRSMAKRLRRSLAVYTASVEKFAESLTATNESSSQLMGQDNVKVTGARKLFIERQHFSTCLPMYEVKPEVIKVLKRNQIVVIMADTGSGKSTQLPQIILDSVLPSDETRRIAVLQPRRVNAILLSRRVAEERGLPPGGEVGYTIGRGESNVTTATRIEFMTHGLFVQIARNVDRLLANYCAVIVDEAHERSVDVDLSLALLKRALKQLHATEDDRLLKVVVTSATITSEAQHFLRYLDPSENNSAVFQVRGHMFPVHVEYRPVVDVDPQVVGTAGVNKVLTSATIQTAMDILRTTENGNILIFLTSEGSINEALKIARNDLLSSGVETVDSSLNSLRSSSLSFRMIIGNQEPVDPSSGVSVVMGSKKTTKKKRKGKTITVSIVGFHGKITRAERDQVLNPPPDRRLVIFSTNVAETGVTLPDIRYVIDTGLERRVRWNAGIDVNEMITQPITKSPMMQRSGRAGRTASGICIRLFPDPDEEKENKSGGRECEPAMQNSMLYSVVLLAKHMKHRLNKELELLDPIDPITLAKTEKRLQELGALDENGALTPEGDALLSLGIDLRLGRFLIACSHFGCLVTGTKLASVLMASDRAGRLLPDRNNLERANLIQKYIDSSGDHLTLLNLVEGFEEAQTRGKGLTWCQDYEVEVDVFVDAETSRGYLLKKLSDLELNILDDKKKIDQNGGIKSSIRRALCAAYFNHLASPRADGTPKAGFSRILDAVSRTVPWVGPSCAVWERRRRLLRKL